jgi:hypothetical protein
MRKIKISIFLLGTLALIQLYTVSVFQCYLYSINDLMVVVVVHYGINMEQSSQSIFYQAFWQQNQKNRNFLCKSNFVDFREHAAHCDKLHSQDNLNPILYGIIVYKMTKIPSKIEKNLLQRYFVKNVTKTILQAILPKQWILSLTPKNV